MWIVYAIVVHSILLGSIFVIYFRSPVLQGLTPQQPIPLEPPADRLVLIVTDGLRAESFFDKNCSAIPHLQKLFTHGLVGVSHTRVPTESRPGHIALLAGLYEDPSAVTRGWKENPVDFDTLFSRSGHTYAWGAMDVLHIFSRLSCAGTCRLFIDAYDHELDFSGRDKTHALDEWVFERVRLFLQRKGAELRLEKQVVFFLHLLGLDSAGHIHKPGSKLFLENLDRTQQGVWDVYNHFEEIFTDGRTVYVLTSDHGMTNTGSHGAGDPQETETPFLLWGAGISKIAPHQGKTFKSELFGILPLYELEQAQITPLMSALLGLPPPMNNFGKLPLGYLNTTREYEAEAVHSNALQLLAQFEALLSEHQRGLFTKYLRHFPQLQFKDIATYKRIIKDYIEEKNFEAAISYSYKVMQYALEGIDFYHSYYRNALLLSTSCTFIGWIFYLLQLLLTTTGFQHKPSNYSMPMITLCTLGGLLVVLLFLQRVPIVIGFYLMFPLFVWLLTTRLWVMRPKIQLRALPWTQLVLFLLCAELLVFTFFKRELISVGFVLYALVGNCRNFESKSLKFYMWLLLVLILATFPLLPPSVGYQHPLLLVLGVLLTVVRPFVVKFQLHMYEKLFSGIVVANGLLCIYQHSYQLGISPISQAISWIYLLYTFVSIIVHPCAVLKQRVELIFFKLTTLYALLCTSYELLFVVMLASELMLAQSTQAALHNPLQLNMQADVKFASITRQNLKKSFSLAFAMLLYTFFSFFGTGNVASVSSFDPNIIRCFLTTFSPFTIMALVILKLVIPVILNICIIYTNYAFMYAYEKQIFVCLLLICDVMGLNFLFLVRNRGSWLEIGSSISHFVIMEVTTLVLLLLAVLAKLLLRLNSSILTPKTK